MKTNTKKTNTKNIIDKFPLERYLVHHKNLLSILFIAFIIRLINLSQSLWLDEAINVLAVKNNNLVDLVTKYSLYDFHPPLYHIILYFWTKIFGYSEIAVRFPSILTTMICIMIVYKIGSEFFSKKIGLTASLLLALSPLSIYYSQEARMYSLTMLFASASFYFFLCLLNKKFSLMRLIIFTLLLALGFYSDYIFWIFGIFLIFYLYKKSSVEKVWLYLILSLVFLFISPWLKFFISQLTAGVSQAKSTPLWSKVVGEASLKNLLLVPVKFSLGRISFYNKTIYTLFTGSLIVLESLAILLGFRKLKEKTFPFLFPLVITILIAFAISLFVPIFSYFRFLFLLPLFYLLISFCVSNAAFGRVLIFLILIFEIISASIYFINPRFHRENWKEVIKFIEENSKGNSTSLLVNIAQGAPYNYYAKTVPLIDEKNLNNSYDKIFFIRYSQPIFDPNEEVLKKIESQGYKKNLEKDFNGVTIWEYKR